MVNSDGLPAFSHPSFSGQVGMATADITPPVGVYSRNWGAASHDVAEDIHRPLTVTACVFQNEDPGQRLVFIDADLGWWQTLSTFWAFQSRVLQEFSLNSAQFIFGLTHTHASPPLAKLDPGLPGGELQQTWLEQTFETILQTIRRAFEQTFSATVDWHTGQCGLATTRDLVDPEPGSDRIICGYDPHVPADQTLVLGRVTDDQKQLRAILVNYACHPTTLAWENKTISPDFIGAMRETIQQHTGAQVLFLQGVSGELSPRLQYVGEPAVADCHGRQLGWSALAILEDMQDPHTELVYQGVQESGAPLAVWRARSRAVPTTLKAHQITVKIPLKNWPTAEEFETQRQQCADRTLAERLRRKRDIRLALGDQPFYQLPLWGWKIGEVFWVGCMAEAYSQLQTELRRKFPQYTIICQNLINGSIGYLPPRELYTHNIYQVTQTPFDEESLELTIAAFGTLIEQLAEAE